MTLLSDSHYGKKYGKCVDFFNDSFPTTGKYQIHNCIHNTERLTILRDGWKPYLYAF